MHGYTAEKTTEMENLVQKLNIVWIIWFILHKKSKLLSRIFAL